MKCIIGLGNPEPEYTGTRHNIGKDFLNGFISSLDKVYGSGSNGGWSTNKYLNADVCKFGSENDFSNILIKPLVNMNESGSVVAKAVNFYKLEIEDVLIAYDELDLVAGEYKLGFDKGSHIHNGIISILDNLPAKKSNFWHLRIGVRNESIPMSVKKAGYNPAKYVLSKFDAADSGKISQTIKNSITPETISWLSKN